MYLDYLRIALDCIDGVAFCGRYIIMFWMGRKRREAATKAAPVEDEAKVTTTAEWSTTPEETPEPATSSNDGDTEEPIVEEDEEEDPIAEEEEEDELDESRDDATPPPAPPADLSPEERLERKRQEAMEAQKVQETLALASNSFCKNQRVMYLHKASGRHYEAVIADVHFDDGLDRPYFTVRYASGNPPETIEKQTTSDRLSYVAFDEAKTYEIISSKIKL